MDKEMIRYNYSVIKQGTRIDSGEFEAPSDRVAKLHITELGTVKQGVPAVHNWKTRWSAVKQDLFEKKCPTHDVRIILQRLRPVDFHRNLSELTKFTHN